LHFSSSLALAFQQLAAFFGCFAFGQLQTLALLAFQKIQAGGKMLTILGLQKIIN
jgi:hypothetical protein